MYSYTGTWAAVKTLREKKTHTHNGIFFSVPPPPSLHPPVISVFVNTHTHTHIWTCSRVRVCVRVYNIYIYFPFIVRDDDTKLVLFDDFSPPPLVRFTHACSHLGRRHVQPPPTLRVCLTGHYAPWRLRIKDASPIPIFIITSETTSSTRRTRNRIKSFLYRRRSWRVPTTRISPRVHARFFSRSSLTTKTRRRRREIRSESVLATDKSTFTSCFARIWARNRPASLTTLMSARS